MAGAIIKGEEHFFTTLYEGNGGGQRVGKFVPFTDNGTISNSCLFETADNDNLSKTYGGAGTSQQTATISAWVKRCKTGNDFQTIFAVGSDNFKLAFNSGTYSDAIQMYYYSGSYVIRAITKRTFQDTTKWYHIVFILDLSNSTQGDRWRLYVDGDRITEFQSGYEVYPGNTSTTTNVGGADTYRVGKDGSSASYDGYIAELNYIDGTAYEPSNFGLTDTSTGRWIPKTLTGLSYGTNGVRLQFGTSSAMGDDTSGNENDYSLTGIDATNQTTDSPTQNHATLQGYSGATLTEGNLKLVTGNSEQAHHNATLKPKSGKYYAEFTCNAMGRSEVGVVSNLLVPYPTNTTRMPATPDGSIAGLMYYGYNGKVYNDSGNGTAATFNTYTTNDIIGIALDLDNLTVQFFKNNSSEGTIPIPNSNYIFAMGDGATGYGGGWTANFGQRSFTYTAPTGFVALQQDNVPETEKGMSDFVWMKNRDATDSHQLYDSSRGPLLDIHTDSTAAETTTNNGLLKFLKGGQQIEQNGFINTSGESYVSWNWTANGGTTSANTDGSGATLASNIQANQTAGFSIVTYTGNATAGAKVAHGLSQAPQWLWIQSRSLTTGGKIYHHKNTAAPETDYLAIQATDATFDSQWLNDTAPDANCFTIGPSGYATNNNGATYVAYCWHEVPGFSKFGSYTGNGNADGPFIYTGFKPAWVMYKQTNTTNYWAIYDSTRSTRNVMQHRLAPNYNYVENVGTANQQDFLSNGIKLRGTDTTTNQSGGTYVYMAFAEHPFNGDGETAFATAR